MILRSIILFFGLVLVSHLHGQYMDAGMWASGKVDYSLNKKTELSFSPEIRLNENLTRWRNLFADLGASYKLQKGLSAEFTYRFGYRNNVFEGITFRQRLQFGLGYKTKWNEFTFSWLTRYQASLVAIGAERDADFVTSWRNKFGVRYGGIKKLELTSAFEFFHGDSNGEPLYWQDWRWTMEAERKINKRNYFSAGYLIQRDLSAAIPSVDYVITLSYKYILTAKGDSEKDKAP